MSNDLAGRVAIVTGAGTGIGRAVATQLARRGASVTITGRRRDPLDEARFEIESTGAGEVLVVVGDHSDEEHVDEVFARTQERFGVPDVLVNNAAIAGAVGSIWELSLDEFQAALTANLVGPWLCCRAAARVMRSSNRGTIVNIGSISGKRALATRTPYTTTKAGLIGLTRTLALELGAHGITVNLVSPGPTDTPRLAELAEKWERPLDDLVDDIANQSALKRISSAGDVAEVVLFLASNAARNITGTDITIDGGIWLQ